MFIIRLLRTLITAGACTLGVLKYLHMLQLESYQLPGYRRYLAGHVSVWYAPAVLASVAAEVCVPLLGFVFTVFSRGSMPNFTANIIAMLMTALAAVYTESRRRREKEKKKLGFTPRMKRLILISGLTALAVSAILSFIGFPPYILLALCPLLPFVSASIAAPYETKINMAFYRDAQATLDSRPDLIKIGITGSYGKTSTKFILNTILSEKYDVLCSPASFNTPMGLTKTIREKLEPRHQVFIAEMGARHKGDIKELVDLVKPKYGLITSIGPQHLETFGNIAAVAATKFELINGLGPDGCAFFSSDGSMVDSLYKAAVCEKYLVGLKDDPASVHAENIICGPHGCSFTLCIGERRIDLTTRMLGSHNISNITLACACAVRLGLSDTELIRGVSRLQPVEHRLQLRSLGPGLTMIDDAFNANPVGSSEALRILSSFPGRHIVVTPGFVEEGERETELNRELGRSIAQTCDIAILVGRRHTSPIAEGALEAGMNKDSVHPVSSLDEAMTLIRSISAPGDTILFENDLPDNYNE